MAIPHLPIVHFSPPNTQKRAARRHASEYLNFAGTQVASFLLGFAPSDPDTSTLGELGILLLRSAALCEGFLELARNLGRQ